MADPCSQQFFDGFQDLISSQPIRNEEPLAQQLELGTPVHLPSLGTFEPKSKVEKLLAANLISLTNLCKVLQSQNAQLVKEYKTLNEKLSSSINLLDNQIQLNNESLEELDNKVDILLAKRANRLEKDSERRRNKKRERENNCDKERESLKRLNRSN